MWKALQSLVLSESVRDQQGEEERKEDGVTSEHAESEAEL